MLFLYFAGTAAIAVAVFWWFNREKWSLAEKIPGPSTIPIIGNILEFASEPDETFLTTVNLFRRFGNTYRLWLGPKLLVYISDPDDAQTVLGNSKIRTRDKYVIKVLVPFLGDGLVTSTGEKWRRHRKIITPAFHFNIFEEFLHVFNRSAVSLVDKLAKYGDHEVINFYQVIAIQTGEMICETMLGIKLDEEINDGKKILQCMDTLLDIVRDKLLNPFLSIDSIFRFSPKAKKQDEAINFLHSIIRDVLQEKKTAVIAEMKSSGTTDNKCESNHENKDFKNRTWKHFFDQILEISETDKSIFNDQEILEEALTLIAAGLETTATTTSFILSLLGLYHDVQDQVYQELKEIFTDDLFRQVTMDDISQMKVLERVIKETLRLYPPLPHISRALEEDIVLKTCVLPKGCVAYVFNYQVHRNTEHWDRPEEFDPDRFLPQNLVGRHPYSYIPFGAGPRNCIGIKYAMLQLKTVVSTVLRHYKVISARTRKELDHLENGMVIKPVGGFLLQFQKRN